VMALEGFILRLCTLLALYICPKGINLEPLVLVLSSGVRKIRSWFVFKRKEVRRRRTVTAGAAAGSV